MAGVDTAELDRRVRAVSDLLGWHLGSIELADVSEDGTVTVQFMGACRACPLKPVTMAATIRRALMSVEGVERVEAVGVNISPEAELSLARLGNG
ncbi:MAG TPA: NifU family protein [Streptosporangiaceae bacterium]|nr:NifU family protein [Streptosporangiaceae bacterium]